MVVVLGDILARVFRRQSMKASPKGFASILFLMVVSALSLIHI